MKIIFGLIWLILFIQAISLAKRPIQFEDMFSMGRITNSTISTVKNGPN